MTARFPNVRLRRLRDNAGIRRMVQETRLSVDDFIYPLFVTHGRDVRSEIPPMPGIDQLSLDQLIRGSVRLGHQVSFAFRHSRC